MVMLKNRVIVITGAGRGIGAGIARLCAAQGASVVVNDLGVELDGTSAATGPAADVVSEITGAGGDAVVNSADIATAEGGEELIRTAVGRYGKLDVVINCAGILRDRMIFNLPEEDWDAVIRVHLKGHFNTIKPAAAYWREQRNADGQFRLINFTSDSALFGNPGQPNYAAAKLGIVGLTYSCANSLAKYGVTSNAISPAAATRMTGSIPDGRRRYSQDGDERDPRHVAPAVAYLASTASGWCNGQVIGVRGYQVSLFNRPQIVRQLTSPVPWEPGRLADMMEEVFKPATEGKQR